MPGLFGIPEQNEQTDIEEDDIVEVNKDKLNNFITKYENNERQLKKTKTQLVILLILNFIFLVVSCYRK